MRSFHRIAAVVALAGLAACGGGEPDLMRLTNDTPGPDEFAIVPNRPLEQPESLSVLPAPTPGGANRSDQNPGADAVAALGGNPGAAAGPVQGPELIQYASRYGVDGNIRGQLAAEDRAFRAERHGRLLERVFNVSTYFRAYAPQSLDQYRELERLRRTGVRTPAAPPEGAR